MKIILTGFMGAGKSTTAKTLSQLLLLPMLEMDDIVYQKTQTKTMHEVFEKGGEPLLRETETAIAQEYRLMDDVVIATGGGVGANKIVLNTLKHKNGKVVYLHADFQILTERLANDTMRPLFKNANEAKSLYHERLPFYREYADHTVEVASKSPADIAHEIAEKLR